MTAAERWRRALEAWAIPEPIVAAAPESPHGFDVSLFARAADEAAGAATPSQVAAREALPAGGTVLDVGCGAGAASVPLVPPAARVVGVDELAGMLDAFAERAEQLGVTHVEVLGAWPDVAGRTPVADVVACHHVLYNVADLAPFVAALDAHARRRVVVELTATHPLAWMNPLWRQVHGIRRPDGPTATNAVAVLRELGMRPEVVSWEGPVRLARAEPDELLAFVRRRLCVGTERDPDLRRALRDHPLPRTRPLVTLSWDPRGSSGARGP
jgi:SAM-dependent methyltransferase